MIDILLVDDQKILLEGLRKIFEPAPDIAVCATCALAELAEEACLRYRPDLVLMDICMESRTSGIRICRRLKERFPAMRRHDDGHVGARLCRLGEGRWRGQLHLQGGVGRGVPRLHTADDGGRARIPRHPRRDTFGAAEASLTERELEILQLVCQSLSREEIAARLGIAKRTVNFHIANMLEKTGHRSIVGLAVEAAEKGLTSMETQNECERDDTAMP